MLDEIESGRVHKDEKGDQYGKKETQREVKPVENSKNLQSFLEISPMQKEGLPSHKLQGYLLKWRTSWNDLKWPKMI